MTMAEEIAAVRNMLTADRNYDREGEAIATLEQAERYADALRDSVLAWHREHHAEILARFCDHEPCKVAAEW